MVAYDLFIESEHSFKYVYLSCYVHELTIAFMIGCVFVNAIFIFYQIFLFF